MKTLKHVLEAKSSKKVKFDMDAMISAEVLYRWLKNNCRETSYTVEAWDPRECSSYTNTVWAIEKDRFPSIEAVMAEIIENETHKN